MKKGFTLLEIIVVLALLALTAAAAVPAFLGHAVRTPEQQAAHVLVDALTQARDAARASGTPATFVLSPAAGTYWVSTRDSSATGVVPLSNGMTLTGTTTDRIECRFDATGTATPLAITIQGERAIVIRVDRWSGDIRIGDAPSS